MEVQFVYCSRLSFLPTQHAYTMIQSKHVLICMFKHLCRQRQFCRKERAELPLELTAVSPWPNEANFDESLEGAAYSTVQNIAYETAAVHIYGE